MQNRLKQRLGTAGLDLVETLVFASRYVMIPIYLMLIVALGAYAWRFGGELLHLLGEYRTITESQLMLAILGLVDISMVASLLVMIIIGGYSSSVRVIDFKKRENRPQGFSHLSSGLLKVKMGMALVGISSIHLLKKFIDAHEVTGGEILILGFIHCMFILSTVVLAKIDLWYRAAEGEHDD
jgi:uncharacterized protein (TIGR00645 family)